MMAKASKDELHRSRAALHSGWQAAAERVGRECHGRFGDECLIEHLIHGLHNSRLSSLHGDRLQFGRPRTNHGDLTLGKFVTALGRTRP